MVHGGRACGILSIPAKEVSLGSPRVGTIHAQAPAPQTPPLQSFLADFSQQTTGLAIFRPRFAFKALREHYAAASMRVCGAGAYPLPDLPRETARSRSAAEKSV